MGISYEDVINNDLMDAEVLEYIPDRCECGAPVAFTDSLRQIYCTSERCIYKIASRLEAMAKKMKVDGFGESTCVTLCKEFKLISPYQVFLIEDKLNSGVTSKVPAFEKKIREICDWKNRKRELWEVVALAGIPNIDTIAYKIFDGYDKMEEAFEDIENGQVLFIAEKLGIKSSSSGVMAVNVYNTLMRFKEELLFGETQFDIYKPAGKTLYMAITGGVRGYRNKNAFVDFLNNRYEGKLNIMLMGSVTQQVNILISDGSSSSNKYKTATRINKKYVEKAIENGLFVEDDLEKFKGGEEGFYKVGEKIIIADSTEIIGRLDRVYNGK